MAKSVKQKKLSERPMVLATTGVLFGMAMGVLVTLLFRMRGGVSEAVLVAGPRFLPTLIQLLLFVFGAAGAGLYFGRFWLSRILNEKDATISAKDAEIAAVERAMVERSLYAERVEFVANSSKSLEEAQEKVEELRRSSPGGMGQANWPNAFAPNAFSEPQYGKTSGAQNAFNIMSGPARLPSRVAVDIMAAIKDDELDLETLSHMVDVPADVLADALLGNDLLNSERLNRVVEWYAAWMLTDRGAASVPQQEER